MWAIYNEQSRWKHNSFQQICIFVLGRTRLLGCQRLRVMQASQIIIAEKPGTITTNLSEEQKSTNTKGVLVLSKVLVLKSLYYIVPLTRGLLALQCYVDAFKLIPESKKLKSKIKKLRVSFFSCIFPSPTSSNPGWSTRKNAERRCALDPALLIFHLYVWRMNPVFLQMKRLVDLTLRLYLILLALSCYLPCFTHKSLLPKATSM